MDIRHKYTTASGLRMALEERLKKIAKVENRDIMRLRKQVAFDRFLARLFSPQNAHILVLKGGYSLELRLNCARTTKDIDLALNDKKTPFEVTEEAMRSFIQKWAEVDLDDFLTFSIGSAVLDLENAPYSGQRFPVECSMAGRRFSRFNIDVGAGDE